MIENSNLLPILAVFKKPGTFCLDRAAMKSFINQRLMSSEAVEALLDAVDEELGVCEIEPIMYVKMRRNGKSKLNSIIMTEKFVSLLNKRGVLLVADLVKQSPAILMREERMLGKEMMAYAAFALMNMHRRPKCEAIFRKALYHGESMYAIRREQLVQVS